MFLFFLILRIPKHAHLHHFSPSLLLCAIKVSYFWFVLEFQFLGLFCGGVKAHLCGNVDSVSLCDGVANIPPPHKCSD